MGDQKVKEPGPADLRYAVLAGNEKVRGEGHGLPRDHKRVGIVSEEHEAHAREEHVVLEAEQPGGSALTAAEIPGREQRDPDRSCAEHREEDARQRVAAQMKWEVGEPERQDQPLGRRRESGRANRGDSQADNCSEREQSPARKPDAPRSHETRDADQHPGAQKGEARGQRGMEFDRHANGDSGWGVGGSAVVASGLVCNYPLIIIACKLHVHRGPS